MGGAWICSCGRANIAWENNCTRCGGDRGVTEKRDFPTLDKDGTKSVHAKGRLLQKMAAARTTPYDSPNCDLRTFHISLGMASAALRQRGHKDMADSVDAELQRIMSIPDLDTEIWHYMVACMNQLELIREIRKYAREHGLVDEVLPYLDPRSGRTRKIPS